jgi:hypothetical protein
MPMLRGIMYAVTSGVERAVKARKEFAKEKDETKKKSELGFVAKDVIINSARETLRALRGKGEKEDSTKVRKAIDFVKALGTVARIWGIGGLAISGVEAPSQSIDKLIAGIKENGAAKTLLWDNFIQNAGRAYQMYAHPIDTITGHRDSSVPKQTEQPEVVSAPKLPPVPEHQEVQPPVEAPATFSMDQFAQERKLDSDATHSLEKLVADYPELKNADSMKRIFDATEFGKGVHSHHQEIIKGDIQYLEQAGGEFRQVIFEEVLKKGGTEDAIKYLESQHFSERDLSHLPTKYVRGGKLDYEKFVKDYNVQNPNAEIVEGLFKTMRAKQTHDFVRDKLIVYDRDGKLIRDIHPHIEEGKTMRFFGLENGKPVLSGAGSVTVDQMGTRPEVIQGVAHKPPAPTDLERLLNEEVNEKTDLRIHKPEVTLEKILNEEVKGQLYVEKTVNTFKASESAPVVESAPTKATAGKVLSTESASKQVPETKVEKIAEVKAEKAPVASEAVPKDETIGEFLNKHGSNPKEFAKRYDRMIDSIIDNLNNGLKRHGGANEFLQNQISALEKSGENYVDIINANDTLSKEGLAVTTKLLNAENKLMSGQKGWEKDFYNAVFEKENKEMLLTFAEHKNLRSHPVLANGGHAVRVWDKNERKDVFFYNKNETNELDPKGNLIIKNASGEQVTIDKKDALKVLLKKK